MIVTLTVNPAVDRTLTVDRLAFEDRAYITSSRESAGGRGINAACVIHSFGGESFAILPSGGKTGQRLSAMLGYCGYRFEVVPIANEIRTNLTVTDKHGLTVNLNEAGPEIGLEELIQIENCVRDKLVGASWLLLCGTLPPGVAPAFYAKLIGIARQNQVKTLLDTDGLALREGVEAHPTVASPNQQEAERLLNRALLTRSHFLRAAEQIHSMGAEHVVLSLGSRGAVAVCKDAVVEVLAPRIDAVCPIGAGDALAAALAWAMERGDSFVDAARWGVAAGTASAKMPGVHFASLEDTRRIYDQVEVRAAT